MPIERSTTRSRRAILAAAAGAAAATVVAAVDRPQVVLAGSDGDVVLGETNTTTTLTRIRIQTNESDVLEVSGTGASVVFRGSNDDYGTGVAGTSATGTGVEGSSTSGSGVLGVSETGAGVLGHSTLSGAGVHGHSFSAGGIGVLATAEAGVAFQVSGKVRFSRAGRASIPAGQSFVDVDLRARGGLAGTPLCFANLMSYRAGVWVVAVRPNQPGTGRLRITLNKAVTSSTFAAWMVLS